MIQISDINKLKDTTSAKTKKTTSGGDFSAYLKDVMLTPQEGISGAAPVSIANAVLAAQTVGEEEERELRKKQLKRGQNLLDKLEEIRDGLLRGYMSKERLMEIARFVNERKMEASDERLNNIIDEIELRVQVELAKLMK